MALPAGPIPNGTDPRIRTILQQLTSASPTMSVGKNWRLQESTGANGQSSLLLQVRSGTDWATITSWPTTPAIAWTTAPLGAPWSNFGSPWASAAYYKDVNSRVWVKGLVKTTANISSGAGNPFWTFPAGLRPAESHVVGVAALGNGVGGNIVGTLVISVDSTGLFEVNNTTGVPGTFPQPIQWTSLEFSFLAEQ